MDYFYKGFVIRKERGDWAIHLITGEVVRYCATLKECKARIDDQTV